VLRNEHYYVSVMMQQAGFDGGHGSDTGLLRVGIFAIALVAVLGTVVVFTPAGSFLKSTAARAAAIVVWMVSLWAVGDWTRRRGFGDNGSANGHSLM
jgi:hypothetical protein